MRILILGGVKSGKSRYAQTLADRLAEQVTLIATATAQDDEMAARIARHQQDRPAHWMTLEEPLFLADSLLLAGRTDPHRQAVVVIDCLTLWLTNLLLHEDSGLLVRELEKFIAAVVACQQPLILISNETNMGVVPLGDLSRRYCDQAGLLHQRLARICDRVELVVAGLPLVLKSATAWA